MGRVIRDRRTNYRGLCAAALAGAVAAWVLLAAVPATASKAEAPSGEQAGHSDHADHHPGGEEPKKHASEPPGEKEGKAEEKDAMEHVLDSYHIELFESFGPHEIPLPTFTIAGHKYGLSKF